MYSYMYIDIFLCVAERMHTCSVLQVTMQYDQTVSFDFYSYWFSFL